MLRFAISKPVAAAVPPVRLIAAVVDLALSTSREPTATRAPSCAIRNAVAAPIPGPPRRSRRPRPRSPCPAVRASNGLLGCHLADSAPEQWEIQEAPDSWRRGNDRGYRIDCGRGASDHAALGLVVRVV